MAKSVMGFALEIVAKIISVSAATVCRINRLFGSTDYSAQSYLNA